MNRMIGMLIAAVLVSGGLVMGGMPSVMAEENVAAKLVDIGNKICPVSGEKVDASSGMAPVTYEYNGKLYHLCCPGCISMFKANPEKYSKIADDEVAAQKEK